jgi:hypothetical protein
MGQGHEPTVLDALPARFVLLQFGRGNWHLERMLMKAVARIRSGDGFRRRSPKAHESVLQRNSFF